MERKTIIKRYNLTETDICYVLNEVLSTYWVLWPFNYRLKAQRRFIEALDKLEYIKTMD